MKPVIPKQPRQTRERLEAKLDSQLVHRLELYCTYLESDRDYVLTQAIDFVLRKDKGFSDWLAARGDRDATRPEPKGQPRAK